MSIVKMIYVGTVLNVIDNSGAKKVKCIKVLNVGKRHFGIIGDEILVSIKEGKYDKGLVKSKVYRAVIVRTKSVFIRENGEGIKFDDNSVVLIKNDKMPLSTRVRGIVVSELREGGFMGVVSLAKVTV